MPPEIQPAATDIPGKLDHQQLCRKRDPLSIGIIRVDKVNLKDFFGTVILRVFKVVKFFCLKHRVLIIT